MSEIVFLVPATDLAIRLLAPHHADADLIAPHWPYRAEHLEDVRREMAARGECRIRAWWDERGCWRAIEGSHRIAAAAELGIEVEIEEVWWADEFEHDQPHVGRITVERMITERVGHSDARYRTETAA